MSINSNISINQVQAEVDQVVITMKNNMMQVIERDQKLGDLEEKSELLKQGATQFSTKARVLKRQMWWKNAKFIVVMVSVILILILILVLIFMLHNKN